ncbi:MAG: glycoside hydrolase family 20 zincin-like fold domain-containing protein [Bryobacteraceae bacterium]
MRFGVFVLFSSCMFAQQWLDLSQAVIVAPRPLSGPARKAATVLSEEILRRSGRTLAIAETAPASSPAIVLEPPRGATPAEGYRIRVEGRSVIITGNDARGTLFGAGHLLRSLDWGRGRVAAPAALQITTSPVIPLRGHQLGYRPKTNSYDAWTLEMWDQYIRDLAIFGANAIELIPPRSDDAADSPHFPAPQIDVMAGMSRIAAEYGLDVWIWYPAMDRDYSDPKTVEFALKEWGDVFRRLPRIDHVFVPGGDPGHTQPKHLMALLEKQTEMLRRHHPRAQMWVSPQSFNQEWMDEFIAILKTEPKWLAGIVHGPQVRVTIPKLRELVPARYPVRNYPDITHTIRAEFPVPDWDLAYALTLDREPINPRPLDQAHIFRAHRRHTNGFLTYSEGCNDDVNKIVWSGLGWNPDANVLDILRDYSRYFINSRLADDFAHGLLALEQNWRGPLLSNHGVDRTLRQFQAMEAAATPQDMLNWRFQQALYRAYYDAYIRSRLLHETAAERRAIDRLQQARRSGSTVALDAAAHELDHAAGEQPAPHLRARVFELAEALYQSIRMQLSVARYKAQSGRGNNLDTIDVPLNGRAWWKNQFAEMRKLEPEVARVRGIEALLDRANPGPGGFYDDLGDPANRPHFVLGGGFAADPYYMESPRIGFRYMPNDPPTWSRFAETHFDTPIEMRYTGLDPHARYRVRVAMTGETSTASRRIALRLMADEKFTVHPYMEKPVPFKPVEFDIPPEATADGELRLKWNVDPGQGGAGRGCQISEVWLMKIR